MKRPAEDRIDDRTAEMNGFCICDIRHVFIGLYSFLPSFLQELLDFRHVSLIK